MATTAVTSSGSSVGEFKVWRAFQRHLEGHLIHWGVVQGWFSVLAREQPCSEAQLARALDAHAALVREWLGCMTAAEFVRWDGDGYVVAPEILACLSGGGTGSVLDLFSAPPAAYEAAFVGVRSHVGSLGATPPTDLRAVNTRLSMGAARDVMACLPSVPRTYGALRRGTLVIDVGCGSGGNLLDLAEAYSRSRFVGLEPDEESAAEASRLIAGAGLSNCEVLATDASAVATVAREHFERRGADRRPLVIFSMHALHDAVDPLTLARHVQRALSEWQGTWLVTELDVDRSHEQPFTALFRAWSFLACVPMGLGGGRGAGVGLLGCSDAYMGQLAEATGLSIVARMAAKGSNRVTHVLGVGATAAPD